MWCKLQSSPFTEFWDANTFCRVNWRCCQPCCKNICNLDKLQIEKSRCGLYCVSFCRFLLPSHVDETLLLLWLWLFFLVVFVVVVRTLCLYDVSVQVTQHLHLILGARRLGTSPKRLCHPTPALMTEAPGRVPVYKALNTSSLLELCGHAARSELAEERVREEPQQRRPARRWAADSPTYNQRQGRHGHDPLRTLL